MRLWNGDVHSESGEGVQKSLPQEAIAPTTRRLAGNWHVSPPGSEGDELRGFGHRRGSHG